MAEFNTEEQRVGYLDGLIEEKDAVEKALELEKDAEKSAEHGKHLAAIVAELKRLGVKPAVEERPAKAAAESR